MKTLDASERELLMLQGSPNRQGVGRTEREIWGGSVFSL